LSELPPWTLRATGFVCGAALLAVATRLSGQRLYVPRDERIQLTFAGVLTVFGFNVLTAFGQMLTQTTSAVIIAFTMPMWAALLSALFLGERFDLARISALLTGMCGLAILFYDQANAFLAQPAGVLFMLGAALSWAAGTVVLKARNWVTPQLTQATWMLGCSALPTMIMSLVFESPWRLGLPSPLILLTLIYHIVFPMVVCYALWVHLVARLPVSVVTLGTLLIPIVGVMSASLILQEAVSMAKLVALSLVLSSIVMALTTKRSHE
jgi:drug/metabolite transporter (DMT)-like permease